MNETTVPEARDLALHATTCAICGVSDNAGEIYSANFTAADLNPTVFSARRLPDRIHYRIVRCLECGLVRSDPVANARLLEELYASSSFEYGAEVTNLQTTYGRCLQDLERFGVRKDVLLEIGCGTGFFLEEALRQGYRAVKGVEPGAGPVATASVALREHIVCQMMRPGIFDADTFDVVCMFQVLDHIASPVELLSECYRILKPGGLILAFNHNIASVSSRVLKERSPIIDIEHTYLYSPTTMSKLFQSCRFQVKVCGPVWNSCSLHHLVWLLPLPSRLKQSLLRFFKDNRIGRLTLPVPLGNLWLVASKTIKET